MRYPNVYGIDMPSRNELIATNRDADAIAQAIGADAVIYQELDALVEAVRAGNPAITRFDTSCFDGVYITGDITPDYLDFLERHRSDGETVGAERPPSSQLDLNFVAAD